ncbi:MAG: EamA family transporter [Candidatus Magasanikbacteria bacterium]|nr:EamA family transporter [Candidatus Magasanikbacteria bacterium]
MWFLFSLSSAFADSIKDVFAKKSAIHIDEYVAAWSQRIFGLVILVPLMLWFWPKTLDATFWHALIIVIFFASIASVWYMKALKYSPLSVVLPIASLTPVFILVTSHFVNHELPSVLGIVGVCIAVIGAYVLQWSKRTQGFFTPFTHLVTDKGSRYMLGVALLWSITSPYDKVAIQHSNTFFYVGIASILYTLILLPPMFTKGRFRSLIKNVKILAPIGFGQVLAIIFQMLAVPLTFVSYVTAVKRSSSIFAPLWGKVFFNEEKIKERLLGTVIILIGIVLMILS